MSSRGEENEESPPTPVEEATRIVSRWASAEKPCVASRDRDDEDRWPAMHKVLRGGEGGDADAAVKVASLARQQLTALKALGLLITKTAPRLRELLQGLVDTDGHRLYLLHLVGRAQDAVASLSSPPDALEALLQQHAWLGQALPVNEWSDSVFSVAGAVDVRLSEASEEDRTRHAPSLDAWRAWLDAQPPRTPASLSRKHNLLLGYGWASVHDRECLVRRVVGQPGVPVSAPPVWYVPAESRKGGLKKAEEPEEPEEPEAAADPLVHLVHRAYGLSDEAEDRSQRVCVCRESGAGAYEALERDPMDLRLVSRLLPRLPALVREAERMTAWACEARAQLDAAVLHALTDSSERLAFSNALRAWARVGPEQAGTKEGGVISEYRSKAAVAANAEVRSLYSALLVPRVLAHACVPLEGGSGSTGVTTTISVWDPRKDVEDACGALPQPDEEAVAAYEAELTAAQARMGEVVAAVHAALEQVGVPTLGLTSAVRVDNLVRCCWAPTEEKAELRVLREVLRASLPSSVVESQVAARYKAYCRSGRHPWLRRSSDSSARGSKSEAE